MTQKASRRKILFFYMITTSLSVIVALAVVEIVLRNIEFTNGINIGSAAHKRWYEKHWTPLNELGFRDIGIGQRINAPAPKIYFLGDSFSAGAGVDFKDTYYYQSVQPLVHEYNPFNLSQPGTSTLQQLGIFQQFNHLTGANAHIVVHQYFLNDIEDHVSQPQWAPPAWLQFSAKHLESAQFLLTYRILRDWGKMYMATLQGAYNDPVILKRHLMDVDRLHRQIRQQNGTVIFLPFPALGTDEILQKSQPIIRRMRQFFTETCRSGDIFINATDSAENLPASNRVVNMLDGHPSAELHALIATRVTQAIRRNHPKRQGVTPYETCVELRYRNDGKLKSPAPLHHP